MIRGVGSLNHVILENVCMCVCTCLCVRAGARVCVPFYLRIYAVDFNRTDLIFLVFVFRIREENNFL